MFKKYSQKFDNLRALKLVISNKRFPTGKLETQEPKKRLGRILMEFIQPFWSLSH